MQPVPTGTGSARQTDMCRQLDNKALDAALLQASEYKYNA